MALTAVTWTWPVPKALGFRFVCNSVDAQGIPSGDICGTCNAAVAARWPSGTVTWRLYPAGGPTNLTAEDLTVAATEAVKRWSQVPNCWLDARVAPEVFNDADGVWGGNDEQQDVLWVDGAPDDWESLTFTNPETTVALAAVRYRCQSFEREHREIFDADIALNNTGLPWGCSEPECWSLPHTMLHEVGHGIGLGHGCGQCTTSVMAALADPAYQPLELTEDDQAGCVALYPEPPPEPEVPPEENAPETSDDLVNDLIADPQVDSGERTGCASGTSPPLGLVLGLLLLAYVVVPRRATTLRSEDT